MRTRAVSAPTEEFGSLWYTNDVADQFVQVDPSKGDTLASLHMPGRPNGLLLLPRSESSGSRAW